jgi:hypothetical protein
MLIPELSAPRRPALNGHRGKITRRDRDGLFPRLPHPSWLPVELEGADQPLRPPRKGSEGTQNRFS